MNFNDIFDEIKNSPDKHPRGCEDYKRIESRLFEIIKKSGLISQSRQRTSKTRSHGQPAIGQLQNSVTLINLSNRISSGNRVRW